MNTTLTTEELMGLIRTRLQNELAYKALLASMAVDDPAQLEHSEGRIASLQRVLQDIQALEKTKSVGARNRCPECGSELMLERTVLQYQRLSLDERGVDIDALEARDESVDIEQLACLNNHTFSARFVETDEYEDALGYYAIVEDATERGATK